MNTKSPRRPVAGRLRRPVQLLALAGLLACSAVSHAGLFSDSGARSQITSVAQDTAHMKAQMQSQGSDLQRQIDSLKQELAQLRGQEDLATHNLNAVQRRQRDIYIDLNARLQAAEKAAPAPAIHAAAAPETAEPRPLAHARTAEQQGASAAAPAAPAAGPKDAQQAYDAAFRLVQLQDRKAIPALQHFLKTYPDTPLAASAQYWEGYLYYTKGFFKRAAAIQEQLIRRYPDSSKAPHALYNLALCRLHLKDQAGAHQILSQLTEKYPTSTDARLARKRLAEMSPAVAAND